MASVLSSDVVLGADRILNVTSDLIGYHCIGERSDAEIVYVLIQTLDIDSTGFKEHVDHLFILVMSQRRLNQMIVLTWSRLKMILRSLTSRST